VIIGSGCVVGIAHPFKKNKMVIIKLSELHALELFGLAAKAGKAIEKFAAHRCKDLSQEEALHLTMLEAVIDQIGEASVGFNKETIEQQQADFNRDFRLTQQAKNN
jgi:hypothetical protein